MWEADLQGTAVGIHEFRCRKMLKNRQIGATVDTVDIVSLYLRKIVIRIAYPAWSVS